MTDRGDLWLLGPHRLLCGDSTNPADVARLMDGEQAQLVATSPPYGNQRTYKIGRIDWDNLVPPAIQLAAEHTAERGSLLVNLGLIHRERRVVRYWDSLIEAMDGTRFPLFGWYAWDKLSGMPTKNHGRLSLAHEWIFHFGDRPILHKTKPCKTAGEIRGQKGYRTPHGIVRLRSHAGRPTQDRRIPDSVIRAHTAKSTAERIDHPAQYSIAFAAELIEPYTLPGELVLDPFGGSGTTLIAAHRLGRRCCLMEIEPSYCDMVLARWEKETGQPAMRMDERRRAA